MTSSSMSWDQLSSPITTLATLGDAQAMSMLEHAMEGETTSGAESSSILSKLNPFVVDASQFPQPAMLGKTSSSLPSTMTTQKKEQGRHNAREALLKEWRRRQELRSSSRISARAHGQHRRRHHSCSCAKGSHSSCSRDITAAAELSASSRVGSSHSPSPPINMSQLRPRSLSTEELCDPPSTRQLHSVPRLSHAPIPISSEQMAQQQDEFQRLLTKYQQINAAYSTVPVTATSRSCDLTPLSTIRSDSVPNLPSPVRSSMSRDHTFDVAMVTDIQTTQHQQILPKDQRPSIPYRHVSHSPRQTRVSSLSTCGNTADMSLMKSFVSSKVSGSISTSTKTTPLPQMSASSRKIRQPSAHTPAGGDHQHPSVPKWPSRTAKLEKRQQLQRRLSHNATSASDVMSRSAPASSFSAMTSSASGVSTTAIRTSECSCILCM